MNKLLNIFMWFLVSGFFLISCNTTERKNPAITKPLTPYYSEKYRPQFHFSPNAHWMNDPNGLFYMSGKYHLYYQYYPSGITWGPMHWGHAISRDLIHWQNVPVALYPDSTGYIFSGSAVVDSLNTSGLAAVGSRPVIAMYTIHNPSLEKEGSIIFQNQGIAFSNDRGMTWEKYAGNPVLKNPGIKDFRDPKVFWYEKSGKWVVILAVHDRVHIYSSLDLKNWKFESEFGSWSGAHGGVWECPDLFPVKVEGNEITKWVMLVSINPGGPNGGSATQYFIGDFDGHTFKPDDNEIRWIDWGPDNYAGVTWSDIPKDDGRRIFIGWMSNWNYANEVPTTPWRGESTIPRELVLKEENKHLFLTSLPLREFGDLRSKTNLKVIEPEVIKGVKEIQKGNLQLMQSEMLFGFKLSGTVADTIEIMLENNLNEKFTVGYSILHKRIYTIRQAAGNTDFSKKFAGVSAAPYNAGAVLKMHLLVDASSVELFVDDGRLVMTSLVFPSEKFTKLKLVSKRGSIVLNKALLYEIERIW